MVLTGKLQGSEIKLFEGQTIGSQETCDFVLHENSIQNLHIEVLVDSSGSITLSETSKTPIFDFAGEKTAKMDLIPGIVFSIGDIGFSIQETDEDSAPTEPSQIVKITDLLDKNHHVEKPIFPLKKPIVLNFIRGALLNTSMELHWSPYSIGPKSNLHHFIDENLDFDEDILSIEKNKENDQTLIRPLISNLISVNNQLISQPTAVQHNDLIEFSDTAFYIKLK